jgi:hypothetical protein
VGRTLSGDASRGHTTSMTTRGFSPGVLTLLVVCSVDCAPRVAAVGDPAADGAPAGARGGAADARPAADFGFQPSDAAPGPAGVGGVGDEGPACAAEMHKAERVPVSLLILMDASSSMFEAVGPGLPTKWELAEQAVGAFVRDPGSAGLGIGIQFFPQQNPNKPCATDTDCPAPPPGFLSSCQEHSLCNGRIRIPCILARPNCPSGTCMPAGLCAISKRLCLTFDQPCPGTDPADTCQRVPRVCHTTGQNLSCDPADYQWPSAGIAPLPDSGDSVTQAMRSHYNRAIQTPIGPALKGGLARLKLHQAANPTHRVALLLVTDGVASGCEPLEPSAIAPDIRAAATAVPSIPTYVIGVFSDAEVPQARPAAQQFATAGGTGMPFVVRTAANLAQELQGALNQIRGSTLLPCEFMIPKPTGSAALDFMKVNVTFKAASGSPEVVPYVGDAARCDPARGGWHYDVDPKAATPSRIIACQATCNRFKAAPGANVSLAIGCKTEVIQ